MVDSKQDEKDGDLGSLRVRIKTLDDTILHLVHERLEVAKEIGKIKLAAKLPIKDFKVEKDVINRSRQSARQIGLYEDMAEEISKLLIKYAVLAQDEFHARSLSAPGRAQKRIAIVGGLGGMGRWLADFLDSFGHQITLHDVKRDGSDSRFPISTDLAAAVKDQDYIFLATPISVTSKVIAELQRYKPKGLIADLCSLKSPLIEAIRHAEAAGLRITSIHPMFGPDVDLLAGRNLVFCDCQNPSLTDEAITLFKDTTANLVRMPLQKHDQVIGYVLGLSHLVNLVFARVLSTSGLSYGELKEASSTTFNAQIGVAAPVSQENQQLYYEIQAENDFTPNLVNQVRQALDDYAKCISAEDRQVFCRLMEEGRAFLGET